ncbi:MAG: efflux RND transporter periplasmic adaptor subunit [Deltaproteobacteria bacterium]|nr:efflux RND transporter periplasmic adaptor subunit [Deltaproteobacteria bacterium]
MKRGVSFKALRVIIVLALAVTIAGLLITMRPKAERQEMAETGMLVEVLPAKAQKLNMIIETYGTVQPREVLKLVAEVRGLIVDMHPSFLEGGFIEKGTTLIKIDPRTYQLEVDRRKVQINQTEAELKRLQQEVINLGNSRKIIQSDVALARTEFFRLKKLSENNVVAQTTLDKADQKYLSSRERLQGIDNQIALTGPLRNQYEAQRDMAKVLLRQAELDLEKTGIVAPFDGWVLEEVVEKGQHANAGQYLGRIYSKGAFDIEARIPMKDLQWLPPISGKDSFPEAKIFVDTTAGSKIWDGRVSRIKAQMDEKTRTLPVVVEVDEYSAVGETRADQFLRPGMFVTVQIKGIAIQQVFLLPRHMVHPGDVVYIVRDDRLNIRPVQVLRRFKNSVYVTKGLSDGELLIKTPLSMATEGMLVRLNSENR